jgi:hypothetical protein
MKFQLDHNEIKALSQSTSSIMHLLTAAAVVIIKAEFERLHEDGQEMTMTKSATIDLLFQHQASLLEILPPEIDTPELLREEMTKLRCNDWRRAAKKQLTGNTIAHKQARKNVKEGKGLVGLVLNYPETCTELYKLWKGTHDGISKEEAIDLMTTIYCQTLAKAGHTDLSVVQSIRDGSIEELVANVRKMVEAKNLDSIDDDNEFKLRAATTHHAKALFDRYVVALTKGKAVIIYLKDGRMDLMMKVSKECVVCFIIEPDRASSSCSIQTMARTSNGGLGFRASGGWYGFFLICVG